MEAGDFAIKLEATQKLLREREKDCQKYMERIYELEQQVDRLENANEEERAIRQDQIVFLQEENSSLTMENHKIQEKLAMKIAENKDLQKQLTKAIESSKSVPARTVSECESENSHLRVRVSELEQENESLRASAEESAREIDEAKAEAQKYRDRIKKMREEAVDKFHTLQQKLTDSRSGKMDAENEALISNLKNQIEEKETEKSQLLVDLENLQKSSTEFATMHMEFVQNLGRILGCEGPIEIVQKVKELNELPAETDKLRLEISNMKGMETINQNEGYVALIEALKQVRDSLSPNELKLPENSSLRQLFASLFNMVNAMMKPTEAKSVLTPHIHAVVLQAQAFSPGKE